MPENWAEGTRTTSFSLAVTHELNETPGLLYPLVGMSETPSDKAHEIEDRFGDLYLAEKTERNGDTNHLDISSLRRWIMKPRSFNGAPLIDRDDVKSTRVDLGSPVASKMAIAVRRYHDDQWLGGYFGNGYQGETAEDVTAVPFDANNIVGAGGVGLTKDKLLEVREKMNLNDVDFEAEMPIMLIDPQSETDLLNIGEYVDSDFNPGHPLARGEIKDWLGFRFIRCNLTSARAYQRGSVLAQPAANQVALPVFVPSGLCRGAWTEFFGDIDVRKDKSFSTQIYAEACSAVVRTDEKKCYQVVVDHS